MQPPVCCAPFCCCCRPLLLHSTLLLSHSAMASKMRNGLSIWHPAHHTASLSTLFARQGNSFCCDLSFSISLSSFPFLSIHLLQHSLLHVFPFFVLSFFLFLLPKESDRCGRCGNLAFCARFPNPCGRVLGVHRGDSVHIVFYGARKFNMVAASATARGARTLKIRGTWRSTAGTIGAPGAS